MVKESLCFRLRVPEGEQCFYIPGTSGLEVIENTWQIKNKKY